MLHLDQVMTLSPVIVAPSWTAFDLSRVGSPVKVGNSNRKNKHNLICAAAVSSAHHDGLWWHNNSLSFLLDDNMTLYFSTHYQIKDGVSGETVVVNDHYLISS